MRGTLPRTVALFVLGVAAAVGIACLLEALSAHAFTPDSDGATVVLEGSAMAHGYPLLQHWGLSLDSFWTVDALWYLVAGAITGISPVLLHVVPAAIAAAVVVLGVVLAASGRTVWAAVAAGGTVVAILALPSHALAVFMLRGPLHVGTTLWCLVAFFCMRRPRFDWRWVVGVAFLVAGLLGDFQAVALGVGPVFLAGVAAAARTRDWRRGLPLVVAAAASMALYEVIRRIARAFGAFTISAANPHSGLQQMLRDVKHGFHELLVLLGLGGAYFGLGGEPTALSYTHAIAAAVVVGALAGSIVMIAWGTIAGRPSVLAGGGRGVRGGRGGRRHQDAGEPFVLDDLLVFGALGSGAAFCFLAVTPNPQYARYLTAAVILSAILAGRVVGRAAEAISWPALGRLLGAVGLAATGCYVVGAAYNLSQPAPVSVAASLGNWLDAHHLDRGIGAYWSASIVTVQTHGKVVVRPVVSPNGARLYRYERNSASYWYDGHFDFLVYQPGAPWGAVDAETATATYGPPVREYAVFGYQILVWDRDLHVAPQSTASYRGASRPARPVGDASG